MLFEGTAKQVVDLGDVSYPGRGHIR
jgi:hypothetical protein